MTLLRCAHISDLHFSKMTWNPSQFFSKRWVGNLNLALTRRKIYSTNHLDILVNTFKNLGISHVFITGDLSCTSLRSEFEMAQTFTASLCSHGMRVFAIPGNHDQYTQQAYKNQTFYDYFDSRFSNEMSLKMDKISSCYLGNQWWLLGMDTALATSWISSSGCFSEQIECNLVKLLSAIPSDHHVVLMNHFPVFKPESPRNKLIRKDALKALLHKFHNIRFYLHGHTHRHSIADLRPNQLPIILDSGSVSHQKNGTWNMLEMGNNTCRVQGYQWSQSPRKTWTPTPEHVFKW